MMKTKSGLGTTFLLLMGPAIYLIMVIAMAASAIAASHEVFVLGKWQEVPKVVVCEDSPIAASDIKKGMNWWENRGHQFDIVDLSEDFRAQLICHDVYGSYPRGYIVITKMIPEADLDDLDMAITFVTPNSSNGSVRFAKIFFKDDGQEERIIEHELGHALGFMHLRERGHMMHPILLYGGWNDRALGK